MDIKSSIFLREFLYVFYFKNLKKIGINLMIQEYIYNSWKKLFTGTNDDDIICNILPIDST